MHKDKLVQIIRENGYVMVGEGVNKKDVSLSHKQVDRVADIILELIEREIIIDVFFRNLIAGCKPQWIHIKDKQPEEGQTVLRYDFPDYWQDWWRNGKWEDSPTSESPYWMPLEPPKDI